MDYEVGDFLLMKDKEILAVSGNEDFFDIDDRPEVELGVTYYILEVWDTVIFHAKIEGKK